MANNLRREVNKSLHHQNGQGIVSSLKYRISSTALANIDEVVGKVEEKRYDHALFDTLTALMQVYSDPDPINKVHRSDNGQVNIEVKSSHSIGEEAKSKPQQAMNYNLPKNPFENTVSSVKGPHLHSLDNISPMGAGRRVETHPDQQTQEFTLGIKQTSKTPVRQTASYGVRGNVEVLD